MIDPFKWWRRSKDRAVPADISLEAEKIERQAELKQAVVTFERRRYSVHRTAELALQRIKDSER